MSQRNIFPVPCSVFCLGLVGLFNLSLSGCSNSARFSDASNPFANPFATTAPSRAAAPTPKVTSRPLASMSPYKHMASAAPVKASASGWSAVGGSPIIVGPADDALTLSARYGVPEGALLAANGLHRPSDIHANMRIVIPIYNTRFAKADPSLHPAVKTASRELRRDESVRSISKPEKLLAVKTPPHDHKQIAALVPAPHSIPVKTRAVDVTPIGKLPSASFDEGTDKFRWPARGRIIQGFNSGGNKGINIALPEGTPVRAAEDGTVVYSGNFYRAYGNLILVRHPNGLVTAYANNGELKVKKGDVVTRGQIIAKSGATGDVSTPQLHFEVRKGRDPLDPTNYLAGL